VERLQACDGRKALKKEKGLTSRRRSFLEEKRTRENRLSGKERRLSFRRGGASSKRIARRTTHLHRAMGGEKSPGNRMSFIKELVFGILRKASLRGGINLVPSKPRRGRKTHIKAEKGLSEGKKIRQEEKKTPSSLSKKAEVPSPPPERDSARVRALEGASRFTEKEVSSRK